VKNRCIAVTLSVILLLSFSGITAAAAPGAGSPVAAGAASPGLRETGYLAYLSSVPDIRPSKPIPLPGGVSEWSFTAEEAGLYAVTVEYRITDEENRDLEYTLLLNGEVPFDEARRLLLRACWTDASMPAQDRRGNDLRPRQIPDRRTLTAAFEDTEGFFDGQYLFYLPQGRHTLELVCLKSQAEILSVTLAAKPEYIFYAEYAQKHSALPVAYDLLQWQEAEQPLYKNDVTLFPISDRSSATTTPYDRAKIKLNTIGGENWKYPGQSVTWEVTVPEDGLYRLSFRLRQNIQLGMKTHRALYINGEIPFAEAQALSFPYADRWVMYTPGDAEGDWLFALSAGRNEITLKVVMGAAARTMRVIQENVMRLNSAFLKMLAITGPVPDRLFEYRLDIQIPSLLPEFEEVRRSLLEEQGRIIAETGNAGGESAILGRLAHLLERCIADPDSIPGRMEDYKHTVSALATYMIVLREQTLEIDKIYLSSPDAVLPRATDTFFRALLHQINLFIGSFFEDYSVVDMAGADSERVLTVWIGGGRDQAQVVKTMANDTFTAEMGIEINLMLVQTDLMTAIVSGNAPDVFLNAGRGMPVDLAMRGALVDLSELPGFDQVLERFMPNASVPYEYRGGTYALPVTQMFHMMFYRTDIFAELGIGPPDTWEEFYDIIPVLQRRNMEIGLPYEQMRGASLAEAVSVAEAGMGVRSMFTTFMLQNGQPLFNAEKTRTTFHEEASVEAFKKWCDLYTMHGLPLWYDFYNRFRIGIMPLGIQGYWMYNYLSVAAPELRGLWAMTPIPGTVMPDGTVNRAEGAAGEGAVIIRGTKDLDGAWEFLQWWTGEYAQARYGHELEMLMGPAARYNTANINAFKRLPWSDAEQALILEQWRFVEEIPVVAGGYYMARNIDNAFRRVIQQRENPRDMLLRFNQDINDEIERKQSQFAR
jgi:ABC-type glycerol-3-phosphate transport system substrate-binding protein